MLVEKLKNKLNYIYCNILYSDIFINLLYRKNNRMTRNGWGTSVE